MEVGQALQPSRGIDRIGRRAGLRVRVGWGLGVEWVFSGARWWLAEEGTQTCWLSYMKYLGGNSNKIPSHDTCVTFP